MWILTSAACSVRLRCWIPAGSVCLTLILTARCATEREKKHLNKIQKEQTSHQTWILKSLTLACFCDSSSRSSDTFSSATSKGVWPCRVHINETNAETQLKVEREASPRCCEPPCRTAAPPGCGRPRPAPSGPRRGGASSRQSPWPTRPAHTDTGSWGSRTRRNDTREPRYTTQWFRTFTRGPRRSQFGTFSLRLHYSACDPRILQTHKVKE